MFFCAIACSDILSGSGHKSSTTERFSFEEKKYFFSEVFILEIKAYMHTIYITFYMYICKLLPIAYTQSQVFTFFN